MEQILAEIELYSLTSRVFTSDRKAKRDLSVFVFFCSSFFIFSENKPKNKKQALQRLSYALVINTIPKAPNLRKFEGKTFTNQLFYSDDKLVLSTALNFSSVFFGPKLAAKTPAKIAKKASQIMATRILFCGVLTACMVFIVYFLFLCFNYSAKRQKSQTPHHFLFKEFIIKKDVWRK